MTFGSPDDDWTFTHQMALDPLCLGHWPQQDVGPRLAACIAAVPQEINDALAFGKPDMLGLNLYNAQPARMGEAGPEYVRRPTGYPRTALGWPVEPDSLNWGPCFIAQRYHLPLYITENGLSCNDKIYLDGKVHDADRIDFTARYLQCLAKGIGRGADVRGYFHWSLIDNFEWYSGYNERFGLYFIDYATGDRIPKDSAFWYARTAAANGANL
nr:family 1 glycosylhydrolase [uncultured Subdoligranulum sp.]